MEQILEKIRSIVYGIAAVLSVALLLILMVMEADAARLNHEKYYQQIWCDQHGGVTEYRLEDGTRVDCLLPDYAIEFDFASKWAESIGQALYYGLMTDRQPGVVLILEQPRDRRYLPRIKTVADDLDLELWITGPEVE
jgi:hypothetical protein